MRCGGSPPVPIIVAAALALAPAVASACSICHASDPLLDALGPEYAVHPGWTLGMDWERYDKEQRFDAIDTPAPGVQFHAGHDHTAHRVEALVEHRVTATVARSLGPRATAVLRLPWSARRLEADIAGEQAVDDNSGHSDPEVLAVVRAWPAPDRGVSGLSFLLGVKTSWGADDRAVGGTRLDEALQAGTGSTDWMLGTSGIVSTPAAMFFGSAMVRRTGSNEAGYEYGDVLLVSVGLERPVANRLRAALSLRLRDAGSDRQDGAEVAATGGNQLSATPRVSVAMGARSTARLSIQIPVASDLEGGQDERPVASAGVTRTF
jgi:hypothetical protein